jgi:hypothetical protein
MSVTTLAVAIVAAIFLITKITCLHSFINFTLFYEAESATVRDSNPETWQECRKFEALQTHGSATTT